MSALTVILAHVGAAPHAHPHGIEIAGALVAGGMLLLLGLGIRMARRER